MRRARLRQAVAILSTFILSVCVTKAETFVWTDGGDTPAWDELDFDLFGFRYPNWSNQTLNDHLPGPGDTIVIAMFQSDEGLIDLGQTRTVDALVINTGTYFEMRNGELVLLDGNISRNSVPGSANHLIASNVTLQQAGLLWINNPGFLHISGKLTAANGFTKTGDGDLVLSNVNNDIDGVVTLQQGKLRISPFQSGYVIDHAIHFNPFANTAATLSITENITATGAITTSAPIHGWAVLDVASGKVFNAAGGLGGSGRMTIAGGGTVRTQFASAAMLWVSNTTLEVDGTIGHGTGIYLENGVLRAMRDITTQGTLHTYGSSSVIDTGAHRVAFGNLAGPMPQYTLVKRGSGTLATPITSAMGGVRLEAGTLETADFHRIDQLTFDGGTLRTLPYAGTRTLFATVNGGGGAIETPTDASITLTLAGSGHFAKSGAGRLTISGHANTFTGGLTVDAGTLAMALSSRSGAAWARVMPGATLVLSQALQFNDNMPYDIGGTLELVSPLAVSQMSLFGSGAITGPSTLNLLDGVQVRVDQAGSTAAIHTNISNPGDLSNPNRPPLNFHIASGNSRLDVFGDISTLTLVRKTGAGTLALHGNGRLFPGLLIEQGVVEVAQAEGIFYETDYLVNDGLLRFNGGVLRLIGDDLRLPGVVLQDGGGTIDLNNRNARIDDFKVQGTGPLTVTGGGTLRLGVANEFNGDLILQGAALEIGHTAALGGEGTLHLNGGIIRGATSQFSLPELFLATTSGFSFNVLELNGASVTSREALRGPGVLGVIGDGVLNFVGSGLINTHAGFTVANGATLRIDTERQLGALPGTVDEQHLSLNGGVLDTVGSFTIAANRGVRIGANGGTIRVSNGQTVTLAGAISSPTGFTQGGLTVDGAGTLALLGNNTYVGGTHVVSGTLQIHDGTALSTGDVLIDVGATLRSAANPTRPVVGNVINQGLIAGPEAFFFEPGLVFTGAVSGAGNFTGNVTFAGSYSPGNSTAQIGFDTLTLGDTNTLIIEIADASDYDRLIATTAITIDGVIDIRFLDGFVPEATDVLTILSAPMISGHFSNAPPTVVDLGGGMAVLRPAHMVVGDIAFELDYFAADGVALRNFRVIPEPATLLMLIAGGTLLLRRRAA